MKSKRKSGNTSLFKNPFLSKQFGLEHLFIKDESENPFGTFKDRVSEFIIKKAIDGHVDKFALITAGNAGYSLSQFAKGTRIQVVCVIDKTLKKSIRQKLKSVAHRVIEVDLAQGILKSEQVVSLARENDEEVIWDVTNGYHEAYESIVEEIKGQKPDYIVVPVGSGEAFVGLYNGIKKHKLRTKLIGIGVKQKYHSLADKLWTPWTPYQKKLETITRQRHKIYKLNEVEIRESYRAFKNTIKCEPSSCVVFSVFSKVRFAPRDKIILVNSGRGLM